MGVVVLVLFYRFNLVPIWLICYTSHTLQRDSSPIYKYCSAQIPVYLNGVCLLDLNYASSPVLTGIWQHILQYLPTITLKIKSHLQYFSKILRNQTLL